MSVNEKMTEIANEIRNFLYTEEKLTLDDMRGSISEVWNSGYNNGYIDGESTGWSDGYGDGYNDGIDVGRNVAVEEFCPPFTESGSVVVCDPVADYPLEVISHIEPHQEGSGEPSPDNIRSIHGYAATKLTHCGKNIFGGEVLVDVIKSKDNGGGVRVNETDKTITFNPGRTDRTDWLFDKFKENTQYTVILYGYNNTQGEVTNLYIQYADGTSVTPFFNNGVLGNTNPVDEIGYSICITTPGKTVKFLRISWANGNTTLCYDKCGIFEGEISIGEFEPYKGETFTFDLGRVVYGGSLNWATGELVCSHVYMALTGDEPFKSGAVDGSTSNYVIHQIGEYGTVTGDSICSHLPKTNIGSGNTNIGFHVRNMSSSVIRSAVFTMRVDGLTRQTEYTQWLRQQYEAGTPVQVCYELKEPTVIQLTPQQIYGLAGTNTVQSNTGDTTVTGRADPIAIINKLTNAITSLGGDV